MTRNTERDAARVELLRLLKGLEFYRAWRISRIKMIKGKVLQEDLNEIVEPGRSFIQNFDNAGSQYSQILQMVRSWYSHTFSELCHIANTGCAETSCDIRNFLGDFRDEVGFDFQSEAGIVAKIARKSIKNGKITRESDYYVLREIEINVDQTSLEDSELHVVFELLRHFESRYRTAQSGKPST